MFAFGGCAIAAGPADWLVFPQPAANDCGSQDAVETGVCYWPLAQGSTLTGRYNPRRLAGIMLAASDRPCKLWFWVSVGRTCDRVNQALSE